MCLALWVRAGVAGVAARLVDDFQRCRRQTRFQCISYARSARKIVFRVCQFLVRPRDGAHTDSPCSKELMSSAFEYRPKYVDIRVRKPAAEETVVREPVDRACDHVG